MLIGEPGVGKTAVVEGLAQRIVWGDVPDGLKDKKLFALDMGALVAEASTEVNLRSVWKDDSGGSERGSDGPSSCLLMSSTRLWERARPRALWTPEILLKPMLARGELHCIGATTLNEYRQYIEKDAGSGEGGSSLCW